MGEAYTSGSALVEAIIQDVGRIANRFAQGVAQIAFDDLAVAHQEIMNSYYGGYSPVSYYHYHYKDPKTGKVYDGMSHGYRRKNGGGLRNSFKPVAVRPSGRHSFLAIINESSDGMSDYVGYASKKYDHVFPASGVFDLVWNEGVRGLPAGFRGNIGPININASPVGVSISGTPSDAMDEFVNTWGDIRGKVACDVVAGSI